MDTRIALKEGTILKFRGSNGTVAYTIQREIGRGGSAIVYNASYRDNVGCRNIVRIKECYPASIRLTRDDTGALHVEEKEAKAFQEEKQEMRRSYIVHKELFYTDGLTNLISNTLDLYEANHTLYTASVYLQGEALSFKTVNSVKECVSIVKNVAFAVRRLHDNGYLYLDIKPENIFVLDGITEIVQLFDFDTLVPLEAVKQPGNMGKYRIACTAGFAALELSMGKIRMLGKHTDVYGIGALLFYLLFGRVPEAPDCESDAEYRFSSCRFAGQDYQDRLFQALPHFFHHSLASYYGDRYQDMDQVIEKLEEIERYADTVVPFIVSARISRPAVVVGREAELKAIHAWTQQEETNSLFLTGMGGIGKSTLVRAYMAEYRRSFDAVLYLYYNDSVQQMIADDEQLHINIVERQAEESVSDYFFRKMKMLRKLVTGKRILLAVDNFSGEIDADLVALLNMEWKIIVITREDIPKTAYNVLRLGAVSEREQLVELFERYLRREIDDTERESLERIIDRVAGHTLALQLIARQVECSHISVREAAVLLKEKGLANMAPESIDYVKDQKLSYDTVSAVINALFTAEQVSEAERAVLKAVPLFPMPGVDINAFAEITLPEIKEVINMLVREGWIQMEGNLLSVHPVIQEVVRQWEWDETNMLFVSLLMFGILKWIEVEGERENYPQKYLQKLYWLEECMEESEEVRNQMLERLRTLGVGGEILLEQMKRLDDNAAKQNGISWCWVTDKTKLAAWLRMSEGVLASCRKEKVLWDMAECRYLLHCTLVHMPSDREEYVLEHAGELLSGQLEEGSWVLHLYGMVAQIYEERGDLDMANLQVKSARKAAKEFHNTYQYGQYYLILVRFYEARIKADYWSIKRAGEVRRMLHAIQRAIFFLKREKEKEEESRILYARALLAYAQALIDFHPRKVRKIRKLLRQVKQLVEAYAQPYSQVCLEYYIVRGWYHTMVEGDFGIMMDSMRAAEEIVKVSADSELRVIEVCIETWANMIYNFGGYEDAAGMLEKGVEMCEKEAYRGVIPYVRKKVFLYACMLDNYYMNQDYEKCREILGVIDAENERNRELGVVKVIAEDYRDDILNGR